MEYYNIYVSTYQGLEEVLKDEIEELLLVENAEIRRRGVQLTDRPLTDVYKLNFHLRTALRVYLELEKFEITQSQDFYDVAKKIEWEDWFGVEDTFKIEATVNNSEFFNNSNYASQLLKDALCDRFVEKFESRPSVSVEFPDVQIHVQISSNSCTISMNSSGESLHKRGYKVKQTPAPISEVLAAGILKLTGWKGEKPLIDPMCGSGTFLAEAFLHSENISGGKFRKYFPFKRWKKFDPEQYAAARKRRTIKGEKAYIAGYDIHRGSIEASGYNLDQLSRGRNPHLSVHDFFKLEKPFPKGIIVMNPPYDVRLQQDDIEEFYAQIGDHLKTNFQGWDAWIFSSNIPALKCVGLKPSIRIPLYNGPLEGRLMHYQLYKGSKRKRIIRPK